MPVRDLLRTSPKHPEPITCPNYTRGLQGKHQSRLQGKHQSKLQDPHPGAQCMNYLGGGSCLLPDELVCIEWLKVQEKFSGERQAETSEALPRRVSNPEVSKPPQRDLFGNPIPPPKPSGKSAKSRKPPLRSTMPWKRAAKEDEAPPIQNPPGLRLEDVLSFKGLKTQVCIETRDFGSIWIVPEYSRDKGPDRKELTPEHAAFLSHVTRTFPEAHIVSFERLPSKSDAGEETHHLKTPSKETEEEPRKEMA